MDTAIRNRLLDAFEGLSDEQRRDLVEFAERLRAGPEAADETEGERVLSAELAALPPSNVKGTPGKEFLKLGGIFSPDDAERIRQAIETDCERVDPDEW